MYILEIYRSSTDHPPAPPPLYTSLRAALASGVSTQRTVRDNSRRSPSSVTRTSQKQRQLRLLLLSVSRTPAQNLGETSNDHEKLGEVVYIEVAPDWILENLGPDVGDVDCYCYR